MLPNEHFWPERDPPTLSNRSLPFPRPVFPPPPLFTSHLWCPRLQLLEGSTSATWLANCPIHCSQTLAETWEHTLFFRGGAASPSALCQPDGILNQGWKGGVRTSPWSPSACSSPTPSPHPRITEQALDSLPTHPRHQVSRQRRDSTRSLQAGTQAGESGYSRDFASQSCSAATGHQVALIDQEPGLAQGRERKAFVDFTS